MGLEKKKSNAIIEKSELEAMKQELERLKLVEQEHQQKHGGLGW